MKQTHSKQRMFADIVLHSPLQQPCHGVQPPSAGSAGSAEPFHAVGESALAAPAQLMGRLGSCRHKAELRQQKCAVTLVQQSIVTLPANSGVQDHLRLGLQLAQLFGDLLGGGLQQYSQQDAGKASEGLRRVLVLAVECGWSAA